MELVDYTDIYNGDRYCLMCRHVCPVTRMTKREATSPHGWALLVASVQRGLLKWDADTIDTLYQCANCGTCQAHCATDRPLPAAIIAARAGLVRAGLQPASVGEVGKRLREWGNPYGRVDVDGLEAEGSRVKSAVGLFVGAAAHFLRPQDISAAVKLLSAAGYPPTLLGVGRSSGYLPYALGLWDTAAELASQTIRDIESGVMTRIVTLSVEDAFALRDVYVELGTPVSREVQVIDLMDFLLSRLEQGRLQFRTSALPACAYHDPCHVTRFPQRSAAARGLIKAAGSSAHELFWREIRTTPCGAIGGLEFTQPRLSEQMARACLEDARQTGAELLLSDDAHCTAQLAQFSDGMPVKSVLEILAENVEQA